MLAFPSNYYMMDWFRKKSTLKLSAYEKYIKINDKDKIIYIDSMSIEKDDEEEILDYMNLLWCVDFLVKKIDIKIIYMLPKEQIEYVKEKAYTFVLEEIARYHYYLNDYIIRIGHFFLEYNDYIKVLPDMMCKHIINRDGIEAVESFELSNDLFDKLKEYAREKRKELDKRNIIMGISSRGYGKYRVYYGDKDEIDNKNREYEAITEIEGHGPITILLKDKRLAAFVADNEDTDIRECFLLEDISELPYRSDGKKICNELKKIRQEYAELNGIDYEEKECIYNSDCKGTCERCDEELRELNKKISSIKNANESDNNILS